MLNKRSQSPTIYMALLAITLMCVLPSCSTEDKEKPKEEEKEYFITPPAHSDTVPA